MDSSLVASGHRPGCKLYRRRWVFLLTLLLLQMGGGFVLTCFELIGNIFRVLWGVTYHQVEWLSLVLDIGPIALVIPFSYAIATRWFTFRTLTLTASFSATIGLLCLACSVALRSLYPLALVGQVFNSFTATLLIASPGIFAVIWFPEEEIGTAIAINIMSLYVGSIIGLTVPPSVFTIPLSVNATTLNSTWIQKDKVLLAGMFSGLLFVALVCTVVLFIFITDHPPMAPTMAQVKRQAAIQSEFLSLRSYAQLVKSLITNRTYVLACLVFGILYQVKLVLFKVLVHMLEHMFGVKGINLNPNTIGEYIMVAFFVGAVVGAIASGELLNKYKRFNVITIVSSSLSLLWVICQVLAFYFGSLPLFYASSALFGLCSQPGVVTLHEIILEESYPIDEVFAAIWLTGIEAVMGIFYAEISKVIFHALGGLAVLIFQSFNLLLALVLCCLFIEHNYRLHANETSGDDNTAL